MVIIPSMRVRNQIVLTLAAFVGVVILIGLLQSSARRAERLERQTDSLNIILGQYRADSAARQRSIDSVLARAAEATLVADARGRDAARGKRIADSLLAIVRADTGDVPRDQFEAFVMISDSVIMNQGIQIDSLYGALTLMGAAFAIADAARLHADSLLSAVTQNRDRWQREAKAERRLGIVLGFGWTAPSGQWQGFIGLGKKIRIPLLGG